MQNEAIITASKIIAKYNSKLAEVFINEPYRRINASYAFAAGFKGNDDGDLPSFVYKIIDIAIVDSELRQARAEICE